MIYPNEYNNWPEPLVHLMQELEDYTFQEIIQSLVGAEGLTATAGYQVEALLEYHGFSYQEILSKIADITGQADAEIDKILSHTAEKMITDEEPVYRALGVSTRLEDSELTTRMLHVIGEATKSEFRNITGSMGLSIQHGENGPMEFIPLARSYQWALDYTVIQTQSGTVSQGEAIKQTIHKMSDSGLRTVTYTKINPETGEIKTRHDHIDVAARRAVNTAMHQVSNGMVDIQGEELGTSLREVSAHQGARDKGDGFENHKLWQGGVYYDGEPVEGYLDIHVACGLGDKLGLGGIECRHSYHIFVHGVSVRVWTDEQLAGIDPPPKMYRGKEYTYYQATQRMRTLEEDMREYERRLMDLKTAGFGIEDVDFQNDSLLLLGRLSEYEKFCEAMGIEQQRDRARVYGFTSGDWSKVRAAARRAD